MMTKCVFIQTHPSIQPKMAKETQEKFKIKTKKKLKRCFP